MGSSDADATEFDESEGPVSLQFDFSPLGEHPLVARVVRRRPTFRVPKVRDDVLAVARRVWEGRARAEYVGVMTVRRFHGLLVDLNAPVDLQELALGMMLQEQQHASACVAASRALGGSGEVTFEFEALHQPRSAAPLHEQLVEMLTGTYLIGERVSLATLSRTVKDLPASDFREVLRFILADEVLHARFAPPLFRQLRDGAAPRWLPWPGDARVRGIVAQQLAAFRARGGVDPEVAQLSADPEAREQLLLLAVGPVEHGRRAFLSALDADVPEAFAEAGFPLI